MRTHTHLPLCFCLSRIRSRLASFLVNEQGVWFKLVEQTAFLVWTEMSKQTKQVQKPETVLRVQIGPKLYTLCKFSDAGEDLWSALCKNRGACV